MNKTELVAAIADDTSLDKKHVLAVIDSFEKVIVSQVAKGEKIALTGFLTFERVARAARTGRNPQTGEAIQVKASKAPKVSAGASFKKAVNI
jgi:DNA-binding protein HU-beta